MGKGKIGAQCAHAAVGAVERVAASQPVLLQQWEECGQAKVCLRAESTAALRRLASEAAQAGLPTFIVQDAGRTQASTVLQRSRGSQSSAPGCCCSSH